MTSSRALASFDHATSCSRMSQDCSLLTEGTLWPLSFTDFPYWGGMTTNGELFEHPMPALLISVRDGSVSLPTPRTSDTNGVGLHGDGGMDLRTAISVLPTPRAQNAESRNTKPWVRPLDQPQNLENALARLIPELLPTPISRDWKDTGSLEDIPENYILPRTIARLFRTPIAEEDKVRWNPHHLTYQLHLQECSNTGITPRPSVGGNLSSEDKHQSPSSMDD